MKKKHFIVIFIFSLFLTRLFAAPVDSVLKNITVLNANFEKTEMTAEYSTGYSGYYFPGLLVNVDNFGYLFSETNIQKYNEFAKKYKSWSSVAEQNNMTDVMKQITLSDDSACIRGVILYRSIYIGIFETRFFFSVDPDGKQRMLCGSCYGEQISSYEIDNTYSWLWYCLDDALIDDFIKLISEENYNKLKNEFDEKQKQLDLLQ